MKPTSLHSDRLCGDADLGITLGARCFEKGRRPASKGSGCKEQSWVPRLSQCKDVPAWVVCGDGVRGAASSLSSSPTAAAGTAASLHLRKTVRML